MAAQTQTSQAAPREAATQARLQQAADALLEAERSHRFIAPLRDTYAPLTIEDAYAIQRINTERRLAAGRRIVGCKIGLTSVAVQKQLGVDQPDFGMLFDDMGYGDGEPIPASILTQPKIEAEIAFVIGRDLNVENPGQLDVLNAIDYALPALEIVGSRVADWNIRITDTIADNASSSAYVLGNTPRQLSEFDARMCGMVLERRGEPVSVGAGAACLGSPINAVVWLARTMAAVGTPLKAGDLVLSGALGPMAAVTPGDIFETRINGLGSVRAVFEPASEAAR
ncbi:fumarylacetoacetate hydrolase family protein [Pandoraea nosoerga]|uniref:2-keto-4-pentenoate hydratase n=1 Tax=Pandoraea nosoerga TaxID=2508296 RepID=A0A5E4WGV2_9BURK|nr:fumarylacetoacetate hydrolase family protein [Pandoraea nosoerga]MBN4667765.1 fumarylacetoacetate hydrolase family protein [Pandoraea nosoerga]MBN4675580.1 fumarylacetoacetate hydrolase family protein [Pandoraea nosoerga]MBN4682673.1 fumarylacetoacetate hydrolase family protein [Pandoraea nosoerga]MBN4746834.1 fumarylacetoacetate hydrolase family protein [Pandoraea nosoerga]VVE24062.1 2-keto-4-pentenoate hydratase [Pandoraea nosoerga]